jgi:hypothetical protein
MGIVELEKAVIVCKGLRAGDQSAERGCGDGTQGRMVCGKWGETL